jgi:hypothetical protein
MDLEKVDLNKGGRLYWPISTLNYWETPALCKTVDLGPGRGPQTVIAMAPAAAAKIATWLLANKAFAAHEYWVGYETPGGYVIGLNMVGTGFVVDLLFATSNQKDLINVDRLAGQETIPLLILGSDPTGRGRDYWDLLAHYMIPHGPMARQELDALIAIARKKNGTSRVDLTVAKPWIQAQWEED